MLRSSLTALAVAALTCAATTGCTWSPRSSLAPRLVPLLAAQNAEEAPAPAKPGVARTALLYLPNRLLDITDIVSASVGVPLLPSLFVGQPVHANLHATRAAQAGVGASDNNVSIGKGYGRRFAPWIRGARELSAGPVTMCKYTMDTGSDDLEFRKGGLLLPTDRPFSEGFMDYWAVGAEAAALPVAVKAEVHPIQIADALLGFFLVDLSDDDF